MQSLLDENPELASMLEEVERKEEAVAEQIASGDHAGAAKRFVEEVALGPGMWEQLPSEYRQVLIHNALTFLDEQRDPEANDFELEWVKGFSKPVLLTCGEKSPPMFRPIVTRLAPTFPHGEVQAFQDAGHVPHVTHPDVYAAALIEFIHRHGR